MSVWMESPVVLAIGWALLHFLWQGAAIAVALATLLWLARDWPSDRRYASTVVAFFALPLCFCVTVAVYLWPEQVATAAPIGTAIPATLRHSGMQLAVQAERWRLSLAWLTPLWMLGVLSFYVRSVGGWIAARKLRTSGVCTLAESWLARLNVPQSIPLLESCRIEAPMVVGLLRPVILVPAGFIAGLPPSQVEAILLHEVAHIRRRDPLVNLLQNFVEGLLFYHPAVWWISRVVRAEREHCCDDQVVAATGDAHGYAAALAALEMARSSPSPALAVNGGNLVTRIRRLLHAPAAPYPSAAPLLQLTVALLLAVSALFAWQSTAATEQTKAPAGPYGKWLNEDVAYIISARERAAFVALQTDAEREHFIEQFWLQRDPTPGTVENEFKTEHYRRIAYANERFSTGTPGWQTDRGRAYIVYGPPDEIESHPRNEPPFEAWFYKLGPDGSPALGVFVGPEMQLAPVGSPLRRAIPPQEAPVPNTHELRLP